MRFAHLHVVFEGCIILMGNCVIKKLRASFFILFESARLRVRQGGTVLVQ